MSYTYNWSEEYVNTMYQSIGIYHPHQLDQEDIAARNGLEIIYLPGQSMRIGCTIVLNENANPADQWQQFGHELGHALWHAGNQITMPMPFRVYQEAKAQNFAQYACIPPFMLDRMKLPLKKNEAIWMLKETFGVDEEFAEKRLHQYMQNLIFR